MNDMRIPLYVKIFSLMLLTTFANLFGFAQSKTPGNKKARQWVQHQEWQPGYTLKIYNDVNAVEFYRQYHASKAAWDKAFAFLADPKTAGLAPGKYPIDGDLVYASITEAPGKTLEQATWESHRRYIDLQYVIDGKEQISVTPIAAATVTHAYDSTRDAANYTATGKDYIAAPGTFYLFFPGDVHRPNVKVPGFDIVKKIVIKIRYAD